MLSMLSIIKLKNKDKVDKTIRYVNNLNFTFRKEKSQLKQFRKYGNYEVTISYKKNH